MNKKGYIPLFNLFFLISILISEQQLFAIDTTKKQEHLPPIQHKDELAFAIATLGAVYQVIYISTTCYGFMVRSEKEKIAHMKTTQQLETLAIEKNLRICIEKHSNCVKGQLGLPAVCESYAQKLALNGGDEKVKEFIIVYNKYFNRDN